MTIETTVRINRSGRSSVLWSLVFCALPAMAPAQTPDLRSEHIHALLINGGDRPASNYLSHLHHLEEMFDVLRDRGVRPEHIDVFSADGDDPLPDTARRDLPPADFWLLEGSVLGNRLKPAAELTDTHWPGVTLHPARIDDLRAWFEAARTEIDPGDRLFIFVTDHGIVDRVDSNKTAIALWQDRLTVTAFRELLSLLDPGVQVVMLMSQCYSGAFAEAMYPLEAGEPSGNVCGFFSTSGERRAYGCYAEGRDRDKVGHAFQFI